MTDVRSEEEIFGSEVLRLIPLLEGRVYRLCSCAGRCCLLEDGPAISRSSDEAVLLPDELTLE